MLMCGVCHSLVGAGLKRCPVCGTRTPGRQFANKTAAASGKVTTSESPVLNYKVCRICSKKIPLKARRCRHCGVKVGTTTNYATILIIALVGVLLVLLLMSAQL